MCRPAPRRAAGETGSLTLTRIGLDRAAKPPWPAGSGESTSSPKRSSEVRSPSPSWSARARRRRWRCLVVSASAHWLRPGSGLRQHMSTATVRSKKTRDLPGCDRAGYHAPRCIIFASRCGSRACREGDRDGMDFLFGLLGGSTLPWILGVGAALVGYKFLSERVRIQAPRRTEPRRPVSRRSSVPAGPRGSSRTRVQSAEEAGQLPGRRQVAGGAAAGWPRPPRPTSRGRRPGRRRPPSRRWAAPRRPPSSSCRPATSRRRPRSSPRPASTRARRRSSSRRATTSRRRGSYAPGEPVEHGGRALREERLPAARRRGVGEGRQAAQGGRGLREALRRERLVLDELLAVGGHPGRQERAPGRAALREGGPARARGHHLLPRRLLRDGGRSAAEARPGREGRRALPAGRGHEKAADRVRAGRRRRARRDAARRAGAQERPAGRGGGVVREGPRLPARRRALRVDRHDARGRRRLRGGRELGRGGRRLHPRGPQGPGRRGLREGGRGRDRRAALPGGRRRRQGGRALRASRRHLQERRGGRARGRAREGDRAAAARAAVRRELPRRDRAPGAALHRDRPARARDGAAAQGDRRRADLGRRTSTSTTGSRSRTRRRARRARRSRSTRRSRPRTCSSATSPSASRGSRAPTLPRPRRPRATAPPGGRAGGARAAPAAVAPKPRRPTRGARVRAAPRASRPQRFVPSEEIAHGPLGAIFRGEDATDGRSVAMRMLNPELLKAPQLLSAVASDLKSASQLSHPNLVKVIALMEWEGSRCVVTRVRRRAAPSRRRSRAAGGWRSRRCTRSAA